VQPRHDSSAPAYFGARTFKAPSAWALGIAATAPLHRDGQLKAEWLALLRDFSDRFVIGSDQFYDRAPERIDGVRQVVNAQPADVARQIGSANPGKIYRLLC